ncbi:MAG: ABC transporter ATP-binding protein [Desulfobacterales bacterium]|nr:ABC transporter ATP-binding protein [Desulfobacterales bacterium]
MSFFKVENISISFGGVKALNEIAFEVNKGEIFSIIGPNGSGKTTLFNCISGIYKPTNGKILFNESNIMGKNPHNIAKLGIARTFQNIELFPYMNTMENLMIGRHIYMKTGIFRAAFMLGRKSFAAKEESFHREKVEEIMELLDLQSFRNRFVGGLPYGVQKRIELGRALALEPKILLLDEPCAGMTSDEKEDMIFLVQDILEILGVTILLIEHDMKVVMDISNRILAINFGSPIVIGKPQVVQNHPEVLKAYLGEE